MTTRTEIRDGMRITWHAPIPMDDGIVLRADVYRPIEDGRYPVILSHGVYGQGLAYQDGYPMQWQKMVADHPEILEGSTNRHQAWEVTDPERLTPGKVYECDVEILPTSIVVPAGWRLALTVRGKDYEYEGEIGEFGKTFVYGTRGTGGMTPNDPDNRPGDVFGGRLTLHTGGGRDSYVLVPVIREPGGS